MIENDHLAEVRAEHTDVSAEGPLLGNIYIGKVQNVVKNLNAAFVEIAPGQPCYLPLEHVTDPVYVKRNSLNKILVQGDEILVQVEKEALKTKSPMVSTNLTLTGRYVILTKQNKKVGISSKLEKEARIHFRNLAEEYFSDDYGIIIRTNAKNASDEAIISEESALRQRMNKIIRHAGNRTCFSCLYQGMPKYLNFVQNSYSDYLEEVVTDLPDIHQTLTEYCGCRDDLRTVSLRLYKDKSYPLASLYNLRKQMERATQKTVFLKSGGSIVIEQAEAMTVIDVNTGKSSGGKDPQKHFRDINLEASREIARQLRLRNISGIIIVDYIDLIREEDQTELLSYLRKQVQSDPIPTQVHDITRLNLVEMTRKKVEKSLMEQLR
ncbi:MAG: ribonuclease E/G [Clostridiales bacterium]|nr:ribonuclease E/G [Clostridiales bacterium]